MKCKVQGVFKNLRYRVLTIDEEEYILDTGNSFWKILFPLLFWISPNSIFKVNDSRTAEKLKSPDVGETKTRNTGPLGAGVGILIAMLLKPLASILELPESIFINTIVLSVFVILVLIMFLTLNHKLKKKLYHTVNLEELSVYKLWIRPKSFKHFIQGILTYFFVLLLNIVFLYLSIAYSDIITLIFTVIVLFALLYVNIFITPVGNTTVKFKEQDRTAI